jgi:hypothetical protein
MASFSATETVIVCDDIALEGLGWTSALSDPEAAVIETVSLFVPDEQLT